MLALSSQRVSRNTSKEVNQEIQRQMEANVSRYASAGPAAIDRRLNELNREWDIERYVETMAPTLTLIGLALGVTKSKKWLVLPAVIQSFFLQHALQGWCPLFRFYADSAFGLRMRSTRSVLHSRRCGATSER